VKSPFYHYRRTTNTMRCVCATNVALLFRSVVKLATPRRSFSSRQLPLPAVLYSNNHLLVIDKPAGWHSIPLENNNISRKCLLSWLKRQSLGGGSRRDFLLPLHRLDQPCTGILLMAKTSKAASRITKVWKNHEVSKEYSCVLLSNSLAALKRASQQVDDNWYELKGAMERSRKPGSVNMMPLSRHDESALMVLSETAVDPFHLHSRIRLCSIRWRMAEDSLGSMNPLIVVQTVKGARHMVRSMLGQVGHAPIGGDIRYGATHPLPDRSVALHASRVTLPDSLVLCLDQKEFVAPLPKQWESWFK